MSLTENSQRRIGILLSYVCIILQTIVGFLYIPLLLHFISREEYGLYQLVGSLIAYFGVMDFGLSSMVVRFYAKYLALDDREGMENILAIATRAYAGIGVLVLLLGLAVFPFLDEVFGTHISLAELSEGKHIYLLLLVNFVVTMLGAVYSAVITARQEFLFLKGLQCVQIAVQPVVVLAVLMQYPSALSVALANTVLNVLLILTRIYYSYARLHIRIAFHHWDRQLFREVGHYMLACVVVTVTDIVFFNTNQVILGIVQGTAAVAVYSLSNLIRTSYMSMSVAISGVFLPHVTEMVARRSPVAEISRLFIKVGRLQFLVLAAVTAGFIVFGREFIHIWAGDGFEDAYLITLLIILPFSTDLIQNLGFTVLQAMNRYEIRSYVQAVVGIVNIILAIPLGIHYSGIGCAFATGLCMFLGNGIGMTYCYGSMLHIDVVRFWRQILRMTAKVAVLAVAFSLLDGIVSTMATGTAFSVKICDFG